jgi:hypothetical protein
MEKIKAKLNEVKQWVAHRFDLDNKFGRVVANTELSAMVVARKIGETVKSEWQEFRESPKEYLKNKFEMGKEKLVNKFKEIRENLSKTPEIKESFVDKLSNWYRNQAENVFKFEEKLNLWRINWEIEKMSLIANEPGKKELKLMILNKIEELNKKRVEYKEKAKKQREINLIFKNALTAA